MLQEQKKSIYKDKLNNIISTELLIEMFKELDEKKNELVIILEDIKKKNEQFNRKISDDEIEKYVKNALEFKEDDKINRTILLKLIDKIVIENKKVKSISYNFSVPNY